MRRHSSVPASPTVPALGSRSPLRSLNPSTKVGWCSRVPRKKAQSLESHFRNDNNRGHVMTDTHRCLIVEDDQAMAEELALLLGALGFAHETVDNRCDALLKLQSGNFCVILL